MSVFGSPGSMSSYAKGPRWTNIKTCEYEPNPASYCPELIGSRPCFEEYSAPFLTSDKRTLDWGEKNGIPGPGEYTPLKTRCTKGAVKMYCDESRFPRPKESVPGPNYAIPNQWIHQKYLGKKVHWDKAVIDTPPSIPYSATDETDLPFPIYNTREIRTSKDRRAPVKSFGKPEKVTMKLDEGPSPMDYNTRGGFCRVGGAFLSKSSCRKSIPRFLEDVYLKGLKSCSPGPASYFPIKITGNNTTCTGPSASFKSRTPQHPLKIKTSDSPGPLDYFKKIPCFDVSDLSPCPSIPRCVKAPFQSSERRFRENCFRQNSPPPTAYNIPGFTHEIMEKNCKNRRVFPNPRLGFGSSDAQRPKSSPYECPWTLDVFDDDLLSLPCSEEISSGRCWRNLRPTTSRPPTGYTEPPLRYCGTPGPLTYDTRESMKFIKARNDFWDPRALKTPVGFNSSGPTLNSFQMDSDIPGTYFAEEAQCPNECTKGISIGVKLDTSKKEQNTPGPIYKLHEKYEKALWRGSHLGTFNKYLKNNCKSDLERKIEKKC